ncbi:MAG: UvrB/UvrC motif-containing protein, partial [Candidatus Pacebacteria bacterium]|nr:UvrB/UvrC motif-containing protein [Candidatus Paceibacterota bacterium]
AVKETDRRRKIQIAYNKEHGITPKTIEKSIKNILEEFGLKTKGNKKNIKDILAMDLKGDNRPIKEIIKDKKEKMREAANNLEFELALILREEIKQLEKNARKNNN